MMGNASLSKERRARQERFQKIFKDKLSPRPSFFFPTRPSCGCNQFKRSIQTPIVYLPNDFVVLQQVELMNIYREQVN